MESAADENGFIEPKSGWTEIFIYPGYRFKTLDCLITNFHLPESTLVMLVSALAGREHVLNAYEEAIRERYRFFSFGDAMFITDLHEGAVPDVGEQNGDGDQAGDGDQVGNETGERTEK